MKKLIVLVFAILLAVFGACKKTYEYIEPKITETSVTQKSPTSVEFRAEVSFTGKMNMVVEWSTHSDMSEPQSHSMYRDGDSHFSQTIQDLEFGTKYYYRFVVSNPNFSLSTEPKSFRIKEGYLYYGDGYRKNRWGYSNDSFSIEWAVMFPSSNMTLFAGSSLSKVRVYVGESASYTLKIYKGGTSSPSTLIKSKDFSGTWGWNEISFTPITLDVTSPLWISVYTYQSAEHYPASCGSGINNKNSRWVKDLSGSWVDGKYWNSKDEDLCWLIQAFITLDAKGENGLEMELPLVPMEQEGEVCIENVGVGIACME